MRKLFQRRRIWIQMSARCSSVQGEIQITDAMINLNRQQAFHGLKYQGKSFDCGDTVGFIAANVAFALERDDIGEAVMKQLLELL
jgi:UTP--glucose-1-phosphate uridylyltransferase